MKEPDRDNEWKDRPYEEEEWRILISEEDSSEKYDT
jgi:hypothetical protein